MLQIPMFSSVAKKTPSIHTEIVIPIFLCNFSKLVELRAKMIFYYVVYLVDAYENIVIPCTWIEDANKMLQKFVNYGLNAHQLHLCYWSTIGDAKTQDGRPNFNYEPNFDAELKTEFPRDEGTFRCRVIKFTSEYSL